MYLFKGFVDMRLLDFWVGSIDGRKRRQYVAGEGGKCIDHVLKKLIAGESMTVVGVPLVIKISGCQKRLLEPRNWKFVTISGSKETEASRVIIGC